jgi:hypothetical protein
MTAKGRSRGNGGPESELRKEQPRRRRRSCTHACANEYADRRHAGSTTSHTISNTHTWRHSRAAGEWQSCTTRTRSSFTESIPQIPAGKRVTRRLRAAAGRAVAEGARTVAQAARDFGLSWPVVHAAFLDHATAVLPEEPGPVVALGIDETRRGTPHASRGAPTPGCSSRSPTAGTPGLLT